MYNETYDDYIRSILGYPVRNQFDQFNQGQQEYQGYQEYRNPTFNTNINILSLTEVGLKFCPFNSCCLE